MLQKLDELKFRWKNGGTKAELLISRSGIRLMAKNQSISLNLLSLNKCFLFIYVIKKIQNDINYLMIMNYAITKSLH